MLLCMNIKYIAGLFDGEGYVGVVQHSTYKRTYTLRVSVTNTRPECLQPLLARFNGSILRMKGGWNGRHCYSWQANGPAAMEFLKAVAPHVIIKKQEIDIALTFPLGRPGMHASDEDVAVRAKIAAKLREFKACRRNIEPDTVRRELSKDPRVQRAVKLYRGGMSCREVSEKIGAEPATVQYWVVQLGAIRPLSEAQKISHKKRFANFYDRPEIKEAVRLYKTGLSALEVARRVKKKPATVNYWLRKLGLTRSLSDAAKLRGEKRDDAP